jgi:hypothetical protein
VADSQSKDDSLIPLQVVFGSLLRVGFVPAFMLLAAGR